MHCFGESGVANANGSFFSKNDDALGLSTLAPRNAYSLPVGHLSSGRLTKLTQILTYSYE